MSYEITGKLVEKFDAVQRTESFRIREFVIENSEESNGRTFNTFVKFQCTQDRTAILDKVHTGDQVKVFFNIKGSRTEKDGRVNYWNNLDAWRIESILTSSSKQSDSAADFVPDAATQDVDDLPF